MSAVDPLASSAMQRYVRGWSTGRHFTDIVNVSRLTHTVGWLLDFRATQHRRGGHKPRKRREQASQARQIHEAGFQNGDDGRCCIHRCIDVVGGYAANASHSRGARGRSGERDDRGLPLFVLVGNPLNHRLAAEISQFEHAPANRENNAQPLQSSRNRRGRNVRS